MKTLFTTNSLPKLKRLYLDKNGISSLSFTSFIPKMPAQHSLSGLQFLSLSTSILRQTTTESASRESSFWLKRNLKV